MAVLECPDCTTSQEVSLTADTYVVVCEACGNHFDVPRNHRVNKPELREYTSRVNVRMGLKPRGDDLEVGWTVQSAEKGNQYLEKRTVTVDVSEHPQRLYWYVAVFKALQHLDEYKSARIWIKHDQVVEHLSGEIDVQADDHRSRLASTITDLCDRRFYGCEFAKTDRVGGDIRSMLSGR